MTLLIFFLIEHLNITQLRHHSVWRGTKTLLGFENSRLQTCLGTSVHSSCGLRLGTSFVTTFRELVKLKCSTGHHILPPPPLMERLFLPVALQVFIGWRSQLSSGSWTVVATSLSKHSSSPSLITQPRPQTSKGIFSHLVSEWGLPYPSFLIN